MEFSKIRGIMDKNFLIDYGAKETEEIEKFGRKFRDGRVKHEDRYPSSNRFKLIEPYTKSINGENIWSQIPLYGTTIITLKPTKVENFKKVHGFEVEDINRLIDFSKETGKIQFALTESPPNYIEMDFLEHLFREIKPPKLIYSPLDWFVDDNEIVETYNEIKVLLENSLHSNVIQKYIDVKYPKHAISQDIVKKGIICDLIRLKVLGHENKIEDFIQCLNTIETEKYIMFQEAIHDLFLHPYDPLNGIISSKKKYMDEIQSNFPYSPTIQSGIEFPCEIGKFLNNKLKLLIPKNIDGVIELSDEYNLCDVRNVMNALNDGVKNKEIDIINEKSNEFANILDGIWSESDRLKKRVNMTRHGLSFGCGIIGSVATLPIGGAGGLLAGLGFNIFDKILDDMKSYDSISEKILKLRTQSHIVHVYDFKKKYKLF